MALSASLTKPPCHIQHCPVRSSTFHCPNKKTSCSSQEVFLAGGKQKLLLWRFAAGLGRRGLFSGHAAARGEALDFADVALLDFQGSCHFIESVLGLLAEDCLAGTEANFGLSSGLILVNLGDCLLDGSQAGGGLLGGLLGLVSASARVQRMGISVIGLAHGVADAFSCARIHVSNHLGVFRGELIQLVHAATNG